MKKYILIITTLLFISCSTADVYIKQEVDVYSVHRNKYYVKTCIWTSDPVNLEWLIWNECGYYEIDSVKAYQMKIANLVLPDIRDGYNRFKESLD